MGKGWWDGLEERWKQGHYCSCLFSEEFEDNVDIARSAWAGVCINKCGIARVIFQMAQGVLDTCFCNSQFQTQPKWAVEISVAAL